MVIVTGKNNHATLLLCNLYYRGDYVVLYLHNQKNITCWVFKYNYGLELMKDLDTHSGVTK